MKFVQMMLAALMALPFLAVDAAAQDYRLQRGDTVQIEVLEDSTLSRSTLVLPDGQITVPQVGTVRAAGRTLEQLQADVAQRLAPSFATPPTVFVTLSSLAPIIDRPERTIDIFVIGAANAPGRVQIPPGSTLLQALSAAGGLSPFAADKRVQLRRVDKAGNEKIYRVDYDAIERGVSNVGTTRVVDGDVIVIPQRKLFE
ncbi:MAG: polysaccharide export protein [Rhodobacteraceae bacterium]|nr:polysaccharide export protein [Paracoccaceae bacterium]MCZ8082609.1 polysaccharide export protein [Paracoccaceae bacterium]